MEFRTGIEGIQHGRTFSASGGKRRLCGEGNNMLGPRIEQFVAVTDGIE
jgi:hypothetical protein